MSEYDFVFEPLTEEEILSRKRNEELEEFKRSITYADMIQIKCLLKWQKIKEEFPRHNKGT